jgi:hypothetical protein
MEIGKQNTLYEILDFYINLFIYTVTTQVHN